MKLYVIKAGTQINLFTDFHLAGEFAEKLADKTGKIIRIDSMIVNENQLKSLKLLKVNA